MDVILKVIEGAKAGSKVAVKKDRFLIGRSPKCHLSAGSTAISRQHSVIMRHDGKVTVRDLGSRNGTRVNGKKITEEVELSSGDELVVGPLKFMVTITHGINNTKRPQVKTVADAVERAVEKGESGIQDDDITNGLLEPDANVKSVAETQTIQMDDTNAAQMQKIAADLADVDTSAGVPTSDGVDTSDDDADGSEATEEAAQEEEPTDDEPGKAGKNKKEPGKLPTRSSQPETKDSREAAVEALRAWNRRR
jgi:pSer/pThr/pTyr-binding forkhead associated (FHA) protein